MRPLCMGGSGKLGQGGNNGSDAKGLEKPSPNYKQGMKAKSVCLWKKERSRGASDAGQQLVVLEAEEHVTHHCSEVAD